MRCSRCTGRRRAATTPRRPQTPPVPAARYRGRLRQREAACWRPLARPAAGRCRARKRCGAARKACVLRLACVKRGEGEGEGAGSAGAHTVAPCCARSHIVAGCLLSGRLHALVAQGHGGPGRHLACNCTHGERLLASTGVRECDLTGWWPLPVPCGSSPRPQADQRRLVKPISADRASPSGPVGHPGAPGADVPSISGAAGGPDAPAAAAAGGGPGGAAEGMSMMSSYNSPWSVRYQRRCLPFSQVGGRAWRCGSRLMPARQGAAQVLHARPYTPSPSTPYCRTTLPRT